MKKTIIILSALIALVACNTEFNQPENTPTVFNITITREGETKAVKSDWEEGDVVYVFFSTVAAPNYVKFTYSSGTWSNTKVGTFDITTNGNMTAIYLPYGNSETVSADGTSFKFANTYTSYYLKAEKAPYTVSGGVVSGTLDMTAPEGFVQFAMPLTNGTTQFFLEEDGYYTLSENNITPLSFASVAADGTISNTSGYNAGDPITGYYYGTGNNRCINFSGILSAAANGTQTDYTFFFVNNRGTVTVYDDVTYKLPVTKTLSYRSAVKFPRISNSAWKVPEPEYVTINGVKWAKWNVGASCVGGYGDYYHKNDPYPKSSYTYSTKINDEYNSDNDVAQQKLGILWHMPTALEIKSIFAYKTNPYETAWNSNVTATWIGNASTYGTVGWKIRDKNNGNELFLPAGGEIMNTNWSGKNTSSDFWCSSSLSLNGNPPGDYYGVMITWNSSSPIWFDASNSGLPVRPVHN